MRRKFLPAVLALALCLGGFAACGETSGAEEGLPEENAAVEPVQSETTPVAAAALPGLPIAASPDNEYVQLLRENNDFVRTDTTSVAFTCDFSPIQFQILSAEYSLTQVSGEADSQSRAINLMAWLREDVKHNGSSDYKEKNALDYLHYAYQEEDRGISCMGLAITLTEMLLSQGIPARTIWLMPGNPEDNDCHVVTIAYIEERGQYIFLDPTYNAYFMNEEGEVLSLVQIRDAIRRGDEIYCNKDAHYNGVPEPDLDYYIHYLAKNFFHFYSYENEGYRSYMRGALVYLCPAGFDATEWEIANREFRNSISDSPRSEEELEADREWIRSQPVYYTTAEDFWSAPQW